MEIETKLLIKYEITINTKRFSIAPLWKKLYFVNENGKLFSLEEGYTESFYEHLYKGIHIYTTGSEFRISNINCYGPSGWSKEVTVRVTTDENVSEKELINFVAEVINYNYEEMKKEYERMEHIQSFTEEFVRKNNSAEAKKGGEQQMKNRLTVAQVAKELGKDACWVRAGLIEGWLPFGFATRNGKKVTKIEDMDIRKGRIQYFINPKQYYEYIKEMEE